MNDSIEMIAVRSGETTQLACPAVGLFTCALEPDSLLGPGQTAGVLITAGRRLTLIVPQGISGRVTNSRPERVHEPVGYGTLLYEISSISAGGSVADPQDEQNAESGLILRAAQAGRFYRRPTPEDPAYVEVGDELREGLAIGLIEIMKTFSQVTYDTQGSLPERTRLVRWLCEDGAEIREGDPLLEVAAG